MMSLAQFLRTSGLDLVVTLVVVALVVVVVADDDHLPTLPWTHQVTLDRENRFQLLWIPGQEEITFELRVID